MPTPGQEQDSSGLLSHAVKVENEMIVAAIKNYWDKEIDRRLAGRGDLIRVQRVPGHRLVRSDEDATLFNDQPYPRVEGYHWQLGIGISPIDGPANRWLLMFMSRILLDRVGGAPYPLVYNNLMSEQSAVRAMVSYCTAAEIVRRRSG